MREVELKLYLLPEHLRLLLAHPALPGQDARAPQERDLHTVYYDTPDHRLAQAGVSLRLRRRPGQMIQALKTLNRQAAGDDAAIARRRGWEWSISGDQPDLALLAAPGMDQIVPSEALAHLVPVFETEVHRSSFWVHPDALTTVEVAFDLGEIRAGAERQPVSEIALGLYAGRVAQLFQLALALQARVPLRIATASKAEAGYALLSGRRPGPCPVEPLALSPATSAAEAFRHILRQALRRLLGNEAGARALVEGADGDAEALHQLRVALRQLELAFRLFDQLLPPPEADPPERTLRRTARKLAAARRWSILAGLIEEALAGRPAERERLLAELRQRRLPADQAASQALGSPGYTKALLRLAAWLEGGQWQHSGHPAQSAAFDGPISAQAGPWLEQLTRKVRKAGRDLAEQAPKDHDRLRRRLKRLSGALEFCRGLYPPASSRAYAAAVEPLLATLDRLDDIAVVLPLAETLPEGEVRAALITWLAGQRPPLLARLLEQWSVWRQQPPFWR